MYQRSEKHKASIAHATHIASQTKTECGYCHNSFTTGNISKHQQGCYENPANLNHCLKCQTRIKHTIRFCSKSCAAQYNNVVSPKRTKEPTTIYTCLSCNTERELKPSSTGKYCDNKCQQDHLWETVTKPSILRGERVKSQTLRRFVEERDGPACSCCGTIEWLGKPMTMDLDHIDGDHRNNFPENIRLLCPNCHRQTPTWGKSNPLRYGESSLRYTPK